eukprot:scaffold1867_cov247-Pinguiococcus_pyrenoidosus.AAC.31
MGARRRRNPLCRRPVPGRSLEDQNGGKRACSQAARALPCASEVRAERPRQREGRAAQARSERRSEAAGRLGGETEQSQGGGRRLPTEPEPERHGH